MIKNTIILQKKIVCDCNAYSYPHALGYGSCIQSIHSSPPFVPPKRGLASKLCVFIDSLEFALQNESDVHSISELVFQFKKDLYGDCDLSKKN